MLLCIIVVIELGFAVRKTMSFRVPVLSRGSDETKDGPKMDFPKDSVRLCVVDSQVKVMNI